MAFSPLVIGVLFGLGALEVFGRTNEANDIYNISRTGNVVKKVEKYRPARGIQ